MIPLFRAPVVANEWVPLVVDRLVLPAVTMLWAPPDTLPRPVVNPVFRAPAVANEWVPLVVAWLVLPAVTMPWAPLDTLPRPVVTLVPRVTAVREVPLPPATARPVLLAVTIPVEAGGATGLAGGLVWTSAAGGASDAAAPTPCALPEAVLDCPPLPVALLEPDGELPGADKFPPFAVVAVLPAPPDGPPGPVVGGPGPGPAVCCGL